MENLILLLLGCWSSIMSPCLQFLVWCVEDGNIYLFSRTFWDLWKRSFLHELGFIGVICERKSTILWDFTAGQIF